MVICKTIIEYVQIAMITSTTKITIVIGSILIVI
jgi:hypothetical protein